jgi:hypothetical protein
MKEIRHGLFALKVISVRCDGAIYSPYAKVLWETDGLLIADEVPTWSNTCGVYAWPLKQYDKVESAESVAIVELTGQVIKHTCGYRAEEARICKIFQLEDVPLPGITVPVVVTNSIPKTLRKWQESAEGRESEESNQKWELQPKNKTYQTPNVSHERFEEDKIEGDSLWGAFFYPLGGLGIAAICVGMFWALAQQNYAGYLLAGTGFVAAVSVGFMSGAFRIFRCHLFHRKQWEFRSSVWGFGGCNFYYCKRCQKERTD